MKQFISDFVQVRGRRLHVRIWGDKSAPLLMMLHGWGDISASWQFVVNELRRDWRVVAPDWPGCGLSEWSGETYYVPDYMADLDALLDYYSPKMPIAAVGHSMGANILCLYAGIVPARFTHVVNLEGVGMPRTSPDDAPGRYGKWLRKLKMRQVFRTYPDRAALAARLSNDNPRLTPDKAEFLSRHIGIENEAGGVDLAIDPAHRLTNPVLYRVEEAKACWRRITAPVLLITAEDSFVLREFFPQGSDEYASRLAAFRNLKEVHLPDCGHNMHHDQPVAVAGLIEDFVS